MNPPTTNFPSYLLPSVFNPRYHQHLNHLNDMAFTHTKMLQELIEKRSIDSSSSSTPSSPSSSSISPMAATSNDSIQQKKRSHSYLDNNNNEEQQQQQQQQQQKPLIKHSKIHDDDDDDDDDDEDDDNHFNKRSRKQLKPQQLLKENNQINDDGGEQSSSEEEIGEVHSQDEKQNIFSIPQPPILPFSPHSLPFLTYIQDLARTNNITSPISMTRFLENLQKEFFSPVNNASIETKRIPSSLPPIFSQTIHHHHPYISQILFNNSFINHYTPPPPPPPPPPPMIHFGNTLSDRTFPFRLSTPKKRRTKVTDTRLSPRITSKIISHEDLIDDDKSLSNHSFESITQNHHHHHHHHHHQHQQSTIEYNAFQTILTSLHLRKAKLMFFYTRYPSSSVLKVYFPDVRFNKLITAQLVKWFSNFREFFYIQIEKYARQYLAEGIRNVEDLIITTDSDLYRVLNLHYNRSNQIDVPISFRDVVQSTLREFFHAIQQQKDLEPSWKKSIYKIIQRLDDQIPDFFKDEHWMHSI
ncbi:unnamed protein product [Rotaria sordida]|uniref:Prospero domain-containing protein n=1 Tax=Rotaria sordida TaxID=392033 RepID=A0A815B4Q9_9BILA|nr:unnamed protein product [Rotaria sordida]CAF3500199.1 unnamed protein product [Rotaria sordida]